MFCIASKFTETCIWVGPCKSLHPHQLLCKMMYGRPRWVLLLGPFHKPWSLLAHKWYNHFAWATNFPSKEVCIIWDMYEVYYYRLVSSPAGSQPDNEKKLTSKKMKKMCSGNVRAQLVRVPNEGSKFVCVCVICEHEHQTLKLRFCSPSRPPAIVFAAKLGAALNNLNFRVSFLVVSFYRCSRRDLGLFGCGVITLAWFAFNCWHCSSFLRLKGNHQSA